MKIRECDKDTDGTETGLPTEQNGGKKCRQKATNFKHKIN